MAIIFLGLLHWTVVRVVYGFGEVRFHLLESFNPFCPLIMSLDLLVLRMALVGSAFPVLQFGQLQIFRLGWGSLLLRFVSSLHDEREESGGIPVTGNCVVGCSSWLA